MSERFDTHEVLSALRAELEKARGGDARLDRFVATLETEMADAAEAEGELVALPSAWCWRCRDRCR